MIPLLLQTEVEMSHYSSAANKHTGPKKKGYFSLPLLCTGACQRAVTAAVTKVWDFLVLTAV